MKKFQNKYRIPSARAQWKDYSNDGAYFITICTAHRECYFGEIINGEMKLSHLGVLADVIIHEIKQHAKNVIVDEYVVMPNHVHFILALDGNEKGLNNKSLTMEALELTQDVSVGDMDAESDAVDVGRTDAVGGTVTVETRHALSLPSNHQSNHQSNQPQNCENEKTPGQKRFQNQGKNTISSIVGSYKSEVTKHAHRLGYNFEWQSRFWDNIVRDQEFYDNLLAYIKNNPAKWEDDKFHPSKPDEKN